MSTQTPNLNLDLREGTDIFNPLSTNSNFETLDRVITEIRKKGGVPTYTTTASANLLKLSENPVPNETLFKFVAAGDANTWSFQETVNNIVTLDGKQKTVKGGEMYVAWVNAANAMVVIAWPDVVDAQTFDGKGPSEWASKAQLDAVNQTAVNATTTAQAAATVANRAMELAQNSGIKYEYGYRSNGGTQGTITDQETTIPIDAKLLVIGLWDSGHTVWQVAPSPKVNSSVEVLLTVSYDSTVSRRTITIKNDGMSVKFDLTSDYQYDNSTGSGVSTSRYCLVQTIAYIK